MRIEKLINFLHDWMALFCFAVALVCLILSKVLK